MPPSPRRPARAADITLITTYAAELADSYWTQTPAYSRTRGGRIKLVGVHRARHPGLLAQLATAAAYGTTSSDDVHGARPVPQSRPPGALEAIALHASITIHAVRWTWLLCLGQRTTVEGSVRQLAAAAAAGLLDDAGLARLAGDTRAWRARAQAAVGWTAPAYAPRVTCPVLTCGQRGTLRVNLVAKAACCRACTSIWDDVDGSIRVLAEWIATTGGRAGDTPSEPVRSGRAGHGAWLTGPADQPIS